MLYWFAMVSSIAILIAAIARYLQYSIDNAPVISISVKSSPFIGRENATKIIQNRYKDVKNSFESALSSSGWSILRKGHENISIETKAATEGGPLFIRVTALFQAAPEKVYSAFSWDQFESTQKVVDPFFESAQLLLKLSANILLIRKVQLFLCIYMLVSLLLSAHCRPQSAL